MEQRTFSDPSIPAFFQASHKPFKVIPQRNNSGQVEFAVENHGTAQGLAELKAMHLLARWTLRIYPSGQPWETGVFSLEAQGFFSYD